MPSPAFPSMGIVNQRTPVGSPVALFIAFAIAASCQVGFGEAHNGDVGSGLSDGRRAVWVLEQAGPAQQPQVAESLLDVGGSKQKRSQNSANPMGMWFGPRLGRRRRSIAQSDLNGAEPTSGNMQSSSSSNDINDYNDLALASLFREGPWSLRDIPPQTAWFNFPDRSESFDDRRMVNFTPRLGRESGEELLSAPLPPPPPPPPVQISAPIAAALRSPPFAPRLGRGLLFSPRMGRSSSPAHAHP